MVNVFLTIDTEVWPFSPSWPATPLPKGNGDFSEEVSNYLYGSTSVGEFGVRFQLDKINDFGLKGTFFVEALSADIFGHDLMRSLVTSIQQGSQEVQLQIHTEWLSEIAAKGLPQTFKQHLREFSLDEQTRVIEKGLKNLSDCGARDLVALRAGNFGGDINTLRAASANGLKFDSSYNIAYTGGACDLSVLGELLIPRRVEGVVEVPVSFFSDYRNHFRPVHLCACSVTELKDALLWASHDEWPSFVIVMHTFELLKNYNRPGSKIAPHPLHLARFEALCTFLAKNKDKFRTMHFRDYVPSLDDTRAPRRYLRSHWRRTVHRLGEQALGRSI